LSYPHETARRPIPSTHTEAENQRISAKRAFSKPRNITDSGVARFALGHHVVVLAFLVLFGFAMLASNAYANHYHDYGGVGHGFVHGTSTTDASMHSRVAGNAFFYGKKICALYYGTGYYGDEEIPRYSTATCNLWNSQAAAPECRWSAWVFQEYAFLGHSHYAHGYNGYC